MVQFALGYLATRTAISAVSVFGFGVVERGSGAFNSFYVSVWVSLVATLVAAGAFGFTSGLSRRSLPMASSIFAGMATALIGIGVSYAYGQLVGRHSFLHFAFLAVILPPALAGAVGRRHSA